MRHRVEGRHESDLLEGGPDGQVGKSEGRAHEEGLVGNVSVDKGHQGVTHTGAALGTIEHTEPLVHLTGTNGIIVGVQRLSGRFGAGADNVSCNVLIAGDGPSVGLDDTLQQGEVGISTLIDKVLDGSRVTQVQLHGSGKLRRSGLGEQNVKLGVVLLRGGSFVLASKLVQLLLGRALGSIRSSGISHDW